MYSLTSINKQPQSGLSPMVLAVSPPARDDPRKLVASTFQVLWHFSGTAEGRTCIVSAVSLPTNPRIGPSLFFFYLLEAGRYIIILPVTVNSIANCISDSIFLFSRLSHFPIKSVTTKKLTVRSHPCSAQPIKTKQPLQSLFLRVTKS
jgi:hypothetical protein